MEDPDEWFDTPACYEGVIYASGLHPSTAGLDGCMSDVCQEVAGSSCKLQLKFRIITK